MIAKLKVNLPILQNVAAKCQNLKVTPVILISAYILGGSEMLLNFSVFCWFFF
jgi:hypothetical protein